MMNENNRHARILHVGALMLTAASLTAASLPVAAAAQTPPPAPVDLIAALIMAEDDAVKVAKGKRQMLGLTEDFLKTERAKVEARITALKAMNKTETLLRASELESLLADYEGQTQTLKKEIAVADANVAATSARRRTAERLRDIANEPMPTPAVLASLPAARASRPKPVSLPDPKPGPTPELSGKDPPSCLLTAPFDTRMFDPEDCLKAAPASGSITIGDRPVQRDGFSAQLTSEGSANAVTLRYSKAFARRTPLLNSGQDLNGWRWSFGVATSSAKGSDTAFIARVAENDEDRRLFESDKLDAGFKVSFGLQYNAFGSSSKNGLESEVTNVIDSAKAMCKLYPNISGKVNDCSDAQIYHWIKSNSGFYQALNNAYWGKAKSESRGGLGLQFELARPQFTYFPLNPALIMTTADIPAGFPDKTMTASKLDISALAYAFTMTRKNTSFLLSYSYKREWTTPAALADVTICTPDTPSPIFVGRCKLMTINAPTATHSHFGGVEFRHYWDGFGIVPALGIAPRYTYEIRLDRHAIDVPIWLAVNEAETALNAGVRVIGGFGGRNVLGEPRKLDWGLAFFLGTNFSFSNPAGRPGG